MNGIEFAPIRPLDDFILQSARFQMPELKDSQRLLHRIINNLIYYQTNYMICAAIIFLLVGLLHPAQMMLGMLSVGGSFAVFYYVTKNQHTLHSFKKKHPMICIGGILVVGYLIVSILGSVLVFMFGIAVPLMAILVHASLRLRNVKNKMSNKIEFVGLKRTPMGLLLEAMGQEQEAGS